jgi:transcriptional regulator with XRE-family HTH domain
MLVKDQLRVRMDQLGIPVNELARRVGVSSQSVRHWIGGRSFPGKAKCNLVEEALTFKLDFSEGNTGQTETIDQKLVQTDLAARNAISLLPPDLQVLFAKLAAGIVEIQRNAQAKAKETPASQESFERSRGERPADSSHQGRKPVQEELHARS